MIAGFLIFALLQSQDEFDKWILQLGGETIEERESAARNLQRMGPGVVGRLEKARESAREAEVKARIESIILKIRKEAELAKILGPTRRVTIAARGEPIKEILRQLHAPGVSEVLSGPLDEEARIDFQVRGATWWEALDSAAKAFNARYRLEDTRDGKVKVMFTRGPKDEDIVQYTEQFRISVFDVRRIAMLTPAGLESAGMVVVELRYQPDLRPLSRTFEDRILIKSVTDAKGNETLIEDLRWVHPITTGRQPRSEVKSAWVRADAVHPLVITGKTSLLFPGEAAEVVLDLEGDGSKTRADKVQLEVESVWNSKDETRVKLTAQSGGESAVSDRIVSGSVFLIDAKGGKYPGYASSTSRSSGGECEWEFEFTSGVDNPRRLSFRWTKEFHKIEVPFRLEGVKLPDLK